MTTFLLMRHGLTDWNLHSRIQGQTDTPLAEQGREQCRAWKQTLDRMDFDRILTSPLVRAMETARLCTKGRDLPHTTDPGLMEMHWGDWTGRSKEDMRADRDAVREQERRGFDFRPPGGESRRELLWRTLAALERFAEAHPGEQVLVVTHNGVLGALARHMAGMEYLPDEEPPLLPYRLHRIEWRQGGPHPLQLNMEL